MFWIFFLCSMVGLQIASITDYQQSYVLWWLLCMRRRYIRHIPHLINLSWSLFCASITQIWKYSIFYFFILLCICLLDFFLTFVHRMVYLCIMEVIMLSSDEHSDESVAFQHFSSENLVWNPFPLISIFCIHSSDWCFGFFYPLLAVADVVHPFSFIFSHIQRNFGEIFPLMIDIDFLCVYQSPYLEIKSQVFDISIY